MEENKKSNGSLIFLIVCVTFAIVSIFLMLFFGNGNGKNIIDNMVDNTTKNVVDNTTNDSDDTEYDNYRVPKEDVSDLIKKVEEKNNLSSKKISNAQLDFFKDITFENNEEESILLNDYTEKNATSAANLYVFIKGKFGKEVECEEGNVCRKLTEKEYKEVVKYYNVPLENDVFVKGEDGNYTTKIEVTGFDEPVAKKTFLTYSQGDNTVLLVVYKEYEMDSDQNGNSLFGDFLQTAIRMHTFKQNNGNYYLSSSSLLDLNELNK